jgi:hypothetical protein
VEAPLRELAREFTRPGLSSLLPDPSSTEVASGIGFERARWPGLLTAAFGFIVPDTRTVPPSGSRHRDRS